MRRIRRPARSQVHFEPLEARTLLSGLTIITHGAEFISTARPSWIDTMATAMRNRVGSATAIYALRMEPNSSGAIVATGFSRIAGPAPTTSSNNETILLLDWAAASGVDLLGLSSNYSTAAVATAVLPYLLTANTSIGLTAPLVEGSIQLIGHSRGGSLVSELAKDLGQRGIWVDQVTLLDPVPVPPDPFVSLKSNVIFADNYWQNSGDGILVPNGTAISGAYNAGPLALGGAYGSFDGKTHGDVHLFYFGTVNTASRASDGSANVVDAWYPNNNLNKNLTGFYYSRLGGGTRPASGLSSAFGGTAARGSLSHSDTQWANLATITLPSYTLTTGQAFTASYRYGSYNTTANITWFLDTDTDPYNGNSIALSGGSAVNATGDTVVSTTAALAATGAATGTYYLVGRIANTTGVRYAYSPAITISNAPIGAIDIAGPTALVGWAVDMDTPATAVSISVKVDGAAFRTGTANLPRADLVSVLGSANHGYAVDLSALTGGVHQVELYANDTTTGTPVLIGSRSVTINHAPIGAIDSAGPAALTGWAGDQDAGTTAVTITVNVDGSAFYTGTASASRPDLTSFFGGPNHGFTVDLTTLTPGIHRIDLYANDTATGTPVLVGSRMVNTNRAPFGSFDTFSATQLNGWAIDANSSASSMILYQIDASAPVTVTASADRADLASVLGSGAHGFAVSVPQLAAGAHTASVWAIDSTSKELTLLGTRNLTVANPAGNDLPMVAVDALTITSVSGWAYDATTPGTSVTMRIDIDGVPGTPFVASDARPDLSVPLGSANFGFSFTMPSLAAGAHRVEVYALDTTSAVPVLVANRMVTAAGVGNGVPLGALDGATSTALTGWAYATGAGTTALVRLDIDGLAGAALATNVVRSDLTALLGAGTFGFNFVPPGVAAGTHSVRLVYLDPVTLAATTLATGSLVTA